MSTFFYEDERFFKVFEDFVSDNADKIDLGTEEMKLEYTDIYEDYQSLFQREIEGGSSPCLSKCMETFEAYTYFLFRSVETVIKISTGC